MVVLELTVMAGEPYYGIYGREVDRGGDRGGRGRI